MKYIYYSVVELYNHNIKLFGAYVGGVGLRLARYKTLGCEVLAVLWGAECSVPLNQPISS